MVSSRRKLSVGKEVDAYCTKCRLDLGHTIMAMVGDTIVKVLCRTCNTDHKYRAPKTLPVSRGAEASSPKSRTRATRTTTKAAKAAPVPAGPTDWEKQLEDAGGAAAIGEHARPYSIREEFSEGEWMLHKRFGLGLVTGRRDSSKVAVLFQDTERVMVMGRS